MLFPEPVTLTDASNTQVSQAPDRNVFRNWVEETERTRKIYFDEVLMKPLKS